MKLAVHLADADSGIESGGFWIIVIDTLKKLSDVGAAPNSSDLLSTFNKIRLFAETGKG